MKLVVGLGNPGSRYKDTRHNIGFMVIDELVKRRKLESYKEKFNAHLYEERSEKEHILFIKPQTYMNLSGVSVGAIAQFYKLSISDLFVIYDDMDLPLGSLRIRLKGSAGGHNGMKSIIQHLGSDNFSRIRLGIGRPERQGVIDFVLQSFSKDEIQQAKEAVEYAASAVECILAEGIDKAMNKYNRV